MSDMRIQKINMNGTQVKALVVDELTPYSPCENCGKANYNHPQLAKEDTDWCMNCNDEEYRSGWNGKQMFAYVMEQMLVHDKAVIICSRNSFELTMENRRKKE